MGLIVLSVATWGGSRLQAGFTLGATIMGMTLGLLGLLFGSFLASRINVPELADPSDHIAHLTVGLLALWGWLGRKPREMGSQVNHNSQNV